MSASELNIKGLTEAEVRERIAKGLQNKTSKTKSKKINEILLENIFSVFNFIILIIMLFLLVFYLKTHDERLLLDSLGVLTIAVVNTLIAIIQEIRAKRALDKVSLLLKKEVNVIRDEKQIAIDQSEIVVDDVIILERGDQVAVDGKIIKANHLEIDESLLTGESLPVEKKDNDNVMSGSFCVSGNGLYIAVKIGDKSYAAEITKLAKKFKLNLSPLQVKLNLLVKSLFGTAIILVLLKLIVRGGDFGQVDFVREISTIVISLVPQGLVLMSSVTFALGIYRISKIGAIVQKLNAIESFSNVKVVCTDKTGTLTQNKLAVNKITLLNDKYNIEQAKNLLGTYAKFSSDKNATLRTLEEYQPLNGAECLNEIPFSSEKKRSAIQLRIKNEKLIMVLGAYDVLIDKVTDKFKTPAIKLYQEGRLEIYRNLLFGIVQGSNKDTNLAGLKDLPGLIEPICIISITDRVRDDVMDAINLFHKNDINIKILSGDSAPAIQAVAREIGWNVGDNELITGNELDKLSDDELTHIVNNKTIFARLKPEHKLRIIKAFRKEKIYTAMIGDGVNDLPAIKEADMGIAMEEGSGITKEVADIVLLKNKFSLLPKIFDEGNKIINTVNRIAKLFLTKNFMIIYSTILSLLFLFDFPFTPRRVALINLFSIGLPSLMIALKNTDVSKTLNFMKDLFSFVMLSAVIITAAGYAGQYFTLNLAGFQNLPGLERQTDLHMIMVSIMVFITTANFYSVVLRKTEKNKAVYIIYGVLLIAVYIFLSLTQLDFIVLNFTKKFYEITYLKPEYWGLVGWISVISSVLLLALQYARGRIMRKE